MTYAEDKDYQKCIRFQAALICPEHGSCDDQGNLVCDKGFKRHNNVCLEDFETKREATKILANFERALQNRLGSYQCNDG